MHTNHWRIFKLFVTAQALRQLHSGSVVAGEYCSRLKGRNTKEFVLNTDKIVAKLNKLLDKIGVGKFCVCLQAFKEMSKILSLNFVDKYNQVLRSAQ